jgi:hypothetical protein
MLQRFMFTWKQKALVALPAMILPFGALNLNAAENHFPAMDALANAPAAEVPGLAANLIKHAGTKERQQLTSELVRTVLIRNKVSAPMLVAAIGRSTPKMTPQAAGVAAEIQPRLAAEIARAAVASAPGQVGKIVAAVCRAAPSQYKLVALAASQAADSNQAAKEILNALGAVFPDLRSGIAVAVESLGSGAISVSSVLDIVKAPVLASAAAQSGAAATGGSDGATVGTPGSGGFPARGPTIAPPYVPYSSSGPNLTPSGSGVVPRGGRNYAAP